MYLLEPAPVYIHVWILECAGLRCVLVIDSYPVYLRLWVVQQTRDSREREGEDPLLNVYGCGKLNGCEARNTISYRIGNLILIVSHCLICKLTFLFYFLYFQFLLCVLCGIGRHRKYLNNCSLLFLWISKLWYLNRIHGRCYWYSSSVSSYRLRSFAYTQRSGSHQITANSRPFTFDWGLRRIVSSDWECNNNKNRLILISLEILSQLWGKS